MTGKVEEKGQGRRHPFSWHLCWIEAESHLPPTHVYLSQLSNLGLSGSSVGKESTAVQETPVQFLGWEDLLGKGQATHSGIPGLPWWLGW